MKTIEVTTKTKIPPDKVWLAWKQMHQWDQKKPFKVGQKGRSFFGSKVAFFEITDIQEKKSFTLTWKAFFVKLLFTHKVEPIKKGSEITYEARFKGIFAPLVQWRVSKKLKGQMGEALHRFVSQLEQTQVRYK